MKKNNSKGHRGGITAARAQDLAPRDADELNQVAGLLFRKKCTVVLGFQALFQGESGARSREAVCLRVDAGPYEPGWVSPDGKFLCVRGAGHDAGICHTVSIHEELGELLAAMHRWHTEYYPDSPWYFPCPDGPGEHVAASALTRALGQLAADQGCRRISAHGLRRFYATVLVGLGFPYAQVARELGYTGGRLVAAVLGPQRPWFGSMGSAFKPNGAPAWATLFAPESATGSGEVTE